MNVWNFGDGGFAYSVTADEVSVRIYASGSIVDPQWEAVLPIASVDRVVFDRAANEFTFISGDARQMVAVEELEGRAKHHSSPFERGNDGRWERVVDRPLGGGWLVGFQRRAPQQDADDG